MSRDTKRQPYAARCDKFLVSPVNAREQLAAFIKGAKQELLIYDSKISDRAMIRSAGRAGQKRALRFGSSGGWYSRNSNLDVRKLPHMRLHTRTIIRDRHQMFLGSQSLRELELDARREVGVIIRDAKVSELGGASFRRGLGFDDRSRRPRRLNPEQLAASREQNSNQSGRGGGQASFRPWLRLWKRWSSKLLVSRWMLRLTTKTVEATVKKPSRKPLRTVKEALRR